MLVSTPGAPGDQRFDLSCLLLIFLFKSFHFSDHFVLPRVNLTIILIPNLLFIKFDETDLDTADPLKHIMI